MWHTSIIQPTQIKLQVKIPLYAIFLTTVKAKVKPISNFFSIFDISQSDHWYYIQVVYDPPHKSRVSFSYSPHIWITVNYWLMYIVVDKTRAWLPMATWVIDTRIDHYLLWFNNITIIQYTHRRFISQP